MTLGISVAEIVANSKNPLLSIHPDWQRVRLDSIAEILNGFAYKSTFFTKAEGIPLLRIRDIGKEETEVQYSGDYDDSNIIKSGDLVIGMDGDFNCGIWRGPKALLNQRVCKVTVDPNKYNPKFLQFVLPGYLKAINESTSSVTVKHLSSKTIGEIPLPTPSLSEQARIVARLEELLSDLDAGVAALERVRVGVKRYKASVLKAACEGRLTSTSAPDVNRERGRGEGELPEGWRWVVVNELSDGSKHALKAGPFGSSLKKEFYVRRGYKIYGQEQVLRGDPNYGEYYIDHERFKLLKTNVVKPGDILISLVGTIGRVLILPEDIEPGIINPRLVKLSLNQKMIINKYFQIYFTSEKAKHYFSTVSHGETMEILNLNIIKNFPIALPPIAEQIRIVKEVEERSESISNIEKTIELGNRRASSLRQAILKSAFEGKLQ